MLPPPLIAPPYLRLSNYIRISDDRVGSYFARGASQSTIERTTFPHKYRRVRKVAETDAEDAIEKCTICLSEFEFDEDVRYVLIFFLLEKAY